MSIREFARAESLPPAAGAGGHDSQPREKAGHWADIQPAAWAAAAQPVPCNRQPVTMANENETETEDEDSLLVKILKYHYGDGMVYLPRHLSRDLYLRAVAKGYLDEGGYLTRKGRILLSRFSYT
jgi:hypothetical protein